MRRLAFASILALSLTTCADDAEVTPDSSIAADTADTASDDTADTGPDDVADTTDAPTADTATAEDTSVLDDVQADTASPAGWSVPCCDHVAGVAGLAISADDATFVLPESVGAKNVLVNSIAVTDIPGTLYLSRDEAIFRSTDGGCSWSALEGVTSDYMLTPSVGGVVLGVWPDSPFVRIEGATVTPVALDFRVARLGVDRTDPTILVAATPSPGVVYRSTNGGASYAQQGTGFEHHSSYVERYTFDPNDVNHIVIGVARTALWTTFDGGATWTNATGFAPGGYVNSFNEAISPVDGDIVWANGISIDENSAGAASEGRHIYRSTDGGLTFAPVLDHTSAKPLNTAMPMTAHPTDPNVVYFVGNGYSDPDAEIRRFDLATQSATSITPGVAYITTFAWAPFDPPTMYVGFGRK